MATLWQPGDALPFEGYERWEIHQAIQGGMGVVYIVYDRPRRETFAAKTFRDELFERIPDIAARLVREADTWINLDRHENVTRACFVQQIEDKPFLFLEYVSGGNLAQWINTLRLTGDVPQLLRFAINLCDGMTHVLARGVKAHCDLKPSNCLITADRVLKITDFGLAKVLDIEDGTGGETLLRRRAGEDLPDSPGLLGTPPYMAPEQFDDPRHLDLCADIYSFGVVLFEMLTGRLPFEAENWRDLQRLHQTQSAPDPVEVSPDLRAVLQVCLAKDPAKRFTSFDAIRGCLAKAYHALTGMQPAAPRPAVALHAQEWYEKGLSLAALGKYEEELKCLARVFAIEPDHPHAWNNKGAALMQLGRGEEALPCVVRSLELDPGNYVAWRNKGLLLSEQDRHAEAADCFDKALLLNPNDDATWLAKGITLKSNASIQESLTCYEHAISLNQRSADTWLLKGDALIGLGRFREALNCLQEAQRLGSAAAGRLIAYCLNVLDAMLDPAQAGNEEMAIVGFIQEGPFDQASAASDRAVAASPNSATAWFLKATALARAGRNEEAIECLDRGLQLDPGHVEGWTDKGNALDHLGRTEEAIACYEQALALDPENTKAWLDKGVALGRAGQYDLALACLDSSLRLNPQYALAWLNKGAVLGEMGRIQEAILCFGEAEKLGHPSAKLALATARDIWASSSEASPVPSPAQSSNASPSVGPGLIPPSPTVPVAAAEVDDPAASSPTPSLRETISEVLPSGPLDTADWLNTGVRLRAEGQHEVALFCYNKALELDPEYQTAWLNKANVLSVLGEFDEAIACYDLALALNSADDFAWYGKGTALSGQGRYDEAVSCYESALEQNPQLEQAWCNKAWALACLSRHEEAIDCYRRALELVPDDVLAWRGTGSALSHLKRYAQAVDCFDCALRISPADEQSWQGKELALKLWSHSAECLAESDAARQLEPQDALKWYNKAVLLGHLGRMHEALSSFDWVLKLDPQLARAWFYRGLALADLGQLREALRHFEEAKRLGHPAAAEMIERCLDSLKAPRTPSDTPKSGLERDPDPPRAAEQRFEPIAAGPPPEGGDAEDWYQRGVFFSNRDRWTEALSCFEEAVRLNPRHTLAWFRRAFVLGKLGRDKECDIATALASSITATENSSTPLRA